MNEMKQGIGDKVRKLRMQQGLTQAQLAFGICDRSHISLIEAGRSIPSMPLLEKLVERLNITLPDLLSDVIPISREASFSFDMLIEHIESLLESQQYYEVGVLVRKYVRHPEIAKSMSHLARLYRYAGIVDVMKKDFDRAHVNMIKAKQQAEKCRDQQILVDVNLSLAALQNYLSNYDESESIYSNVLYHASKELPLPVQTKLHYGLGLALQGQGKIQKALNILKSRLEQLLKNNSLFLFGEIMALIASCYEKLKSYSEAIPYYEKTVAYHILKGSTQQASLFYDKIAECYKALGEEGDFKTFRTLAMTVHSTKQEVGQLDERLLFYSASAF
jgi:HTH-type transcriptional regulator, quorum sensing regulator NprR